MADKDKKHPPHSGDDDFEKPGNGAPEAQARARESMRKLQQAFAESGVKASELYAIIADAKAERQQARQAKTGKSKNDEKK